MDSSSLLIMHGAYLSGNRLKFVEFEGCYLYFFMRYENRPTGVAGNTPFSIGGEIGVLPAVMPSPPVTC